MSSNWYALRIKPHKEKSVFLHLEIQQEIEPFLPMVKVQPKNPRAAKQRPYFPGYMFVQADMEQIGANTFNWLPGTLGLVSFGGEPAIVPEHLIIELQSRLAEIEEAGGLQFEGLKKGDTVRIVGGPFEGYEAIFNMQLSGKDRVQVLLSFLSNYPQPIELDAGYIEKMK